MVQQELLSKLEWRKGKRDLFTYKILDYPMDNATLIDNIEWNGQEWVRNYDAYPDGGDIEPAHSYHLQFILEKYEIPNDIIPIEAIRCTPPEKLESLQEQVKLLGGNDRFRSLLILITNSGFTVERYLGAGGWGIVFEVSRKADGARIALKLLKPPYTEEWRKRFLREVAILESLSIEAEIIGIESAPFEVDGLVCLPMKFVDGRPLSDLVLPVAPHSALIMICEILSALLYVHDKQIVHRDLHLGNVMLDSQGRLIIVDFGVSREEHVQDGTYTFRPVGAMSHCAPEKWLNPSKVNTSSDIFSVGVMLYRLLTGKYPFWADSYIGLYEQIREGTFIDTSNINQAVPSFIDIVIRNLLATELSERPNSAQDALVVVKHAEALMSLYEKQGRKRRHIPNQAVDRSR